MVKRHSKLTFMTTAAAVLFVPVLLWNLQALLACDITEPVIQVMSYWPRDEYLLICFQGDGRSVAGAAGDLERAVRRYGKRVNVKPVPVSVDSGTALRAPVTVVSPRGKVLVCYEKPPAPAELQALFESPGRRALVEALKKHDSVFLCILDPKSDTGEKAVRAVKGVLKLARDLTEFKTALLVIDAEDPAERYLVKNVTGEADGSRRADDEPAVALVCARGRVADLTWGVPNEEQLIDRLQRIYGFGGYATPSRFGEDLLLVW